VESGDIAFKFANFGFATGDLDSSITTPSLEETVTMTGCLSADACDISRLELQTGTVEPGSRIRLRHYKQNENDAVIDHEEFPHYRKPIPAPPDRYPHDNACETRLRPVQN